MSDTLFALLHLAALLAILAYAGLSLFTGNTGRGVLLLLLLAIYYLLVLHKAVRKEIARRRARR
jgi:hypothetical protein